MNKFDQIYNKIISEWNFGNDKTKLKCLWDEADELLSIKEIIEKYVDYSDVDYNWNDELSDDDNLIKLYDALINDKPNSKRVNFIVNLLSDDGHKKLQESYNSKQENNFISNQLKTLNIYQ